MEARLILFLVLAVISADGIPVSRSNEHLPFAQDGPSSRGTDFFVGFLPNIRNADSVGPLLQLLVSTDEPEPVTFTVSLNENLPEELKEGFPLTTTVSYGEVKKINIHKDMAPTATAGGTNQIERSKAIRIRTEGGKKVSVQGFNDEFRTTDGFMAFPCDAMRNSIFTRYEYLVLAGDQQAGAGDPKKQSLFLIIPCDDNTVVRLEPSQTITLSLSDLPSRAPPQIMAGRTGSFTANAGQTILIEHPSDLSGSIVRGSKPVVVLSGHECAEVPLDVTACDHLVEQMPPGMAYGQTFFLVPLAARVSGDFFRVGTLTNGAEVTITCVNSIGDDPKNIEPIEGDSVINRGETLTFLTPRNEANDANYKPSYCCLDASKPVVVAQYSTGYSYDSSLTGKPSVEVGDPFMSIIPPVTQYMNNYTITSLDGIAGPFSFRYVNLAIAAEFFNNSVSARQQIRINGSAASPLDGYIPFYCSNNEICGYGAQVEVTSGTINIYHERPDVGLSMSNYAYQLQNSYGFPQGYELTPISAATLVFQDIIISEDIGTINVSIPRVGNLNIRSIVVLNHQSIVPEEARVGEDYVDFGPVTLTYRGGNTQDDLMEFAITIINDNVDESTERFQIVGVPTQNVVIPKPILTVTILDDDGAPTPNVFFDPTSYVVNETAGTVTLIIRTDVIGGPQSGAVQFYTENGEATAPGDYASTPVNEAIPVSFGSDQLSTTVTVSIQNDNTMEPDENFFGRLRRSGTGDVLITQNRAEVTIINDDVESAVVSISPSAYEVPESASAVNVMVTKTGNFLMSIEGSLTTSFGSAGASDYEHGVYQFVIQPMQQQVTIPIRIIDDATVEELREQFSVSVSFQAQPGLSLGNSQGTITIIDNDVEIGFNLVQYQVMEDAQFVTFEVYDRNPDREGEYRVQFTTTDGSAEEDGDYVTITQEIIFLPGDQLKAVNVTIIDDDIFENLEEFSAQLSTLDERVVLADYNAVAQIMDDDSEVDISISPLGYEVDESAGPLSVSVQKSGTFPFPISGNITTMTGEAGSNDFIGGTYSFTILPSEQDKTVSIPIINDEIVEQLRERFTIILSVEMQPGLSVGNNQTSIIIVDDDGIVISLQPSTQTVPEGSAAIFRVVTTGHSELPYSVEFTTADGSAEAPGDYRSAILTLTRQQLANGFQIRIPVENDTVLEAQERFQGRLELTRQSVDLGVVTLDQSVGEVVITDDDTVSIGFSPSIYSVNEDSESVIFFIQNQNPDMERIAVIEFITVEGTAIDDRDYSGIKETITFEPGQSIATVQVMITNDNVYEGVQEFSARLTTTDSGVNIFEPEATIQITDDDEITVQFNPVSYTVTEGGSTQLIIRKIGIAEEPVTVSLSTQEGVANNSDFTQLISLPVTFGSNEFERSITIATTLDNLMEGTENFMAKLTAVSDRVLITANTADVLIQETANVIVEFEPNIYVVNENDGMVNFIIVKRAPTTQNITVYLSTFDGTASAPSDYLPTVNEEVTFTPSETMAIVTVPIQRDNVYEGNESFTATLTLLPDSSGIEIGRQGSAAAFIIDETLIISFSSLEYTISEDGGPVEVCLTTSSVVSEGFPVVLLAQQTLPAVASDGQDFIGGEYRVQFPAGVTQHCTDIPIIDDSIALEGDELFIVKFDANQLPDGVEPDSRNTSTVHITDDDEVRVSFDADSYQVSENEGSVSVCVTTEDIIAQGFSIAVATQDLQADAGSDYEQVTTPLIFRPGDGRQCFNIPILPDEIDEGKEDFAVRITFLPGGVVASPHEVTFISILDINVLVVEFSSANYSVPENEDTVSVCLTTSIGSSQPVSVIISTAPKTATAGVDYIGSPSVVSIPASPGPSQTCFEIDINDDTIAENDEEFLVNFQLQAGSDAQIGRIGSTCIRIIDNDVLTIQFGSPNYSVLENDGTVTVCLTTNIGSSQPVSVIISTTPKTATAGIDYSERPRNVSIPTSVGPQQTCFEVDINDDNVAEEDEEFLVTLQIQSGSDAQIGAISSTCVRIIDDDEIQEIRVFFESESYSVLEDGGSVNVCVRRSGMITETFSIRVATINVDASDGSDYDQVDTNLTFRPSEDRRCFNITILNDQVREETELFSVEILSVTSGMGVVIDNIAGRANISIMDNDVLINFASSTYTILENRGSVSVCLTTSGAIDEPVSVAISAIARSASSGADFTFTPLTVTIPALNHPTGSCFNVGIINDNSVESDEVFLLSLQVPADAAALAGAIFITSITIVDDDVVTVDFCSPTYTISEDGGSVEVCLTTSTGNNERVTLPISTVQISALAGKDYDGQTQLVALPASTGPSETCFNITIIDDQNLERTEEFCVNFQIPFGSSARPGDITTSCITIIDNDQAAIVEFVDTMYSVVENEGKVQVCLRLRGSIGSSVVVQLIASPQTAQVNFDYRPGMIEQFYFRTPGNTISCTTFDIIDDKIALEENETFAIEVVPVAGPVEIGRKNRATITIEDDDVVRIRPSTENEIVFESDGMVQVCLVKNKDTAQPLQVNVIVGETVTSDNPATAGSDFVASISTITLGEQDRESCIEVRILNDAVANEPPEVFQVNFILSQDQQGSEIVNPVSMVTIIDDDVDPRVANDSVVADPLFTAPILGGGQLCYEIHGKPNIILNLVSDKCTSVNANYASMNIASDGNIISAVGIKAADGDGNCHNIEVRLTPPEVNTTMSVHIDDNEVSGVVVVDRVRVRTYTNRVRVSVPNCELIDLVMWVLHMKVNDQDMLKFVISRGVNLAPTSHGLIGQFWNVPVSVNKYSGPLQPGYESFLNRDILYLITVTSVTGRGTRSFLGELHDIAWDQRTGPCYYVGSLQGGRTAEREENESVIEGRYTDYRVKELFDDDFIFSKFEDDRCVSSV